jgi:hypothetical protein
MAKVETKKPPEEQPKAKPEPQPVEAPKPEPKRLLLLTLADRQGLKQNDPELWEELAGKLKAGMESRLREAAKGHQSISPGLRRRYRWLLARIRDGKWYPGMQAPKGLSEMAKVQRFLAE